MFSHTALKWGLLTYAITLSMGCGHPTQKIKEKDHTWKDSIVRDSYMDSLDRVKITKNVTIRDYFQFMDSLSASNRFPISEHVIVWNNPWIMDTLANTDYYRLLLRDTIVYDQKNMIVLPKGSVLILPDSLKAAAIEADLERYWLDVNIPEFTLRIYQDSIPIHAFPIRVGQNRSRYLVMTGQITDLRTKTGTGTIVRHVRYPDFYNPVDGRRFFSTKRDDGQTTEMPQIPWIETAINGVRNGQLIHPTTNPVTLGKAYSNGCIGVREADAWMIYYHAPIGTKIRIRYELHATDSIVLEDIYRR